MSRRVSAREADDAERHIQDLLRKGSNRYCADCGDRSPNHVVLSLGTFVCSICAGIHRDAKRSGVRSLDTATFSMDDAYRMEDRGNDLARKRWMARWSPRDFPEPKPGDTVAIREFIWLKYDGSWASKSMIPAGSDRSASRSSRAPPPRDYDRRDRDRGRDYERRHPDRDLDRRREDRRDRDYDYDRRRDVDRRDRDRSDRRYRDDDRYGRDSGRSSDRRVRRGDDDDTDSEDERRRRRSKKKSSKKSKKSKYDSEESESDSDDSEDSDDSDSHKRKSKKKGKSKSKKDKKKGGKPAFAGSIDDLINQNTSAQAASASSMQSFGNVIQTPMGPAVMTPQGLMPPAMAAQMMAMGGGAAGGMGMMGAGMGAGGAMGMNGMNPGMGMMGGIQSGMQGMNEAPAPAPLALPAPPGAMDDLNNNIQTLNISDNPASRVGMGMGQSGIGMNGGMAQSGMGMGMNPGMGMGQTGMGMNGGMAQSGAGMMGGGMGMQAGAMGMNGGMGGGPAMGMGAGGMGSAPVAAGAEAGNPFSGGGGGSTNPFDEF